MGALSPTSFGERLPVCPIPEFQKSHGWWTWFPGQGSGSGSGLYIPSETSWFDSWIVKFETAIGPVQVINVHLRPPISDSGSWVSGYLTTSGDRRLEMERFYAKREPR